MRKNGGLFSSYFAKVLKDNVLGLSSSPLSPSPRSPFPLLKSPFQMKSPLSPPPRAKKPFLDPPSSLSPLSPPPPTGQWDPSPLLFESGGGGGGGGRDGFRPRDRQRRLAATVAVERGKCTEGFFAARACEILIPYMYLMYRTHSSRRICWGDQKSWPYITLHFRIIFSRAN